MAYLKPVLPEIRSSFRFKEKFALNARDKLGKIKFKHKAAAGNDSLTFVGIHVRRGDYVYHIKQATNNTKRGYVGVDYYERAIKYFQEKIKVDSDLYEIAAFFRHFHSSLFSDFSLRSSSLSATTSSG